MLGPAGLQRKEGPASILLALLAGLARRHAHGHASF